MWWLYILSLGDYDATKDICNITLATRKMVERRFRVSLVPMSSVDFNLFCSSRQAPGPACFHPTEGPSVVQMFSLVFSCSYKGYSLIFIRRMTASNWLQWREYFCSAAWPIYETLVCNGIYWAVLEYPQMWARHASERCWGGAFVLGICRVYP